MTEWAGKWGREGRDSGEEREGKVGKGWQRGKGGPVVILNIKPAKTQHQHKNLEPCCLKSKQCQPRADSVGHHSRMHVKENLESKPENSQTSTGQETAWKSHGSQLSLATFESSGAGAKFTSKVWKLLYPGARPEMGLLVSSKEKQA